MKPFVVKPITFFACFGLAVAALSGGASAVLAEEAMPANVRVAPMALPPHPRLLITDPELEALKARIQTTPELKAIYDKLLATCDNRLKKPVQLPDRGGQWYHWYACKKDGARLKQVPGRGHVCPLCGTVYTGWPYDDCVLANIHDEYSRSIMELGLAYRLTGKPEYAARAREILLAYSAKYLTYPEHDKDGKPGPHGGRINCQKLDEATWLIPIDRGADLIWDTLSDEDRAKIETGLLRPAVAQIRLQSMGIHNIQCWMNSAVGLTGLLLNDPEMVQYAVDSPTGFKQQIIKGITEEGQWCEGAWAYHFYATNAMAPLAEAGERCGLNLYAYEAGGRSYRMLFEAPLAIAMPNLELPAFNDSVQVSLPSQKSVYELGLARFGDPAFAAILASAERTSLDALLYGKFPLPAAAATGSTSRNYPETGYAVMRHGAGTDAAWLCLKYGPHGGGHGHPDKLNFVFYAKGKVLGVDSGTANYGVPIQAGWYRSTLAHNTLTVDQKSQKPATGSSLAWLEKGDVTAILADAGPIYDGVRYRRAVALFGQDTLLVLDIADSDAEHTFDFAYHEAGTWSTAPAGEAVALPDQPGYSWLKDVVTTAAPLPVINAAAAGEPALPVHIVVSGPNTGEILAGTGVGKNATDRVPCVIYRTKGQKAVVGWVISLANGTPELKVWGRDGNYFLTGLVNGKNYNLTVSPDATEKLKIE